MCGGGDTTNTSRTELDPAIRAQLTGNINLANTIAAGQPTSAVGPYPAYTGPRIAGFSEPTMAALRALPYALGQSTPYFQQARERVATPTGPEGVSAWLNPAMGTIEEGIRRNADIQRNQRAAAAAASKAFGTRRDVMEGQADEAVNRVIGETRGGMWNSAASNYLAGQQQNQNAANVLAQLGIQQRQQTGQDLATLLGFGQQIEDRNQKALDLGYNEFVAARDWPLRALQLRTAALTGNQLPSTTTQTGPGPNPVAGGLGALLAIAGMGGKNGFGFWGK